MDLFLVLKLWYLLKGFVWFEAIISIVISYTHRKKDVNKWKKLANILQSETLKDIVKHNDFNVAECLRVFYSLICHVTCACKNWKIKDLTATILSLVFSKHFFVVKCQKIKWIQTRNFEKKMIECKDCLVSFKTIYPCHKKTLLTIVHKYTQWKKMPEDFILFEKIMYWSYSK